MPIMSYVPSEIVLPTDLTLEEVERRYVLQSLADHAYDKGATATKLGVSLKTIYNLLNRWGMKVPSGTRCASCNKAIR